MNPLPDRVVLIGVLATIGLCFALVFWSVRLNPRLETPLQWRDGPSARLAVAAPARGSARPATG
ncbi:hypothetical protein [Cyanobium sp. CH-040]|uniref:hypothetical protein n=1 Tax=Cyanobium sp. CH-040 TaxID=2823708 RepID=UPI0020CC8B1F|nr:hypothetical protein [Cyanobium sp. CH-040]MCP9926848.1 hypothetical protein [Cyanobium sp. CH-040]